MLTNTFRVRYDNDHGLVLDWEAPNGVNYSGVLLQAEVWGESAFYIWGQFAAGDSGETAPVWAEPDLHLTFLAPYSPVMIEERGNGYRIVDHQQRATVVLDLQLAEGRLEAEMAIVNPHGPGARPLPMCRVELRFVGLPCGPDATFHTANAYGGRTYGYGKVAELIDPGLPFVHGCIGLALPLLYVHDPAREAGLELEFMLDGRPQAWIRPGGDADSVTLALRWEPERLLGVNQLYAFGGIMRLTPYAGRPLEMLRRWRDAAGERYGLLPVPCPEWARHGNIIEFWLTPDGQGYERLDDPRYRELLARFKQMGFTTVFAVAPNHTGLHALSPFDYAPCEKLGGNEGERQLLDLCHELGYRIILWVTTVGIDKDAREVTEHPDWFTQRQDGSLFYAWDSNPQNGYVGYAPDGDPLSRGWRAWLEGQVVQVLHRGYDGIFIDGCIPRASNHARWDWPGQGRNSVEDQVVDLAALVRKQRPELITFVEDQSLAMQASTEMSMGRYVVTTPYLPKAHFDLGMGGGPKVALEPPQRIQPEQARDFLLVRYASILPGVVTNDILEGYYSEETRPWTVESLFAGNVPKTHSPYLLDPTAFIPLAEAPEPTEEEKSPAHRRRGTDEFIALLKFCQSEPALLRDAPLTIEGVTIDGDAAVVGMLRPSTDRCLLAVINFADRPATVHACLAPPSDVPAAQQVAAGHPEQKRWHAREVMHSMVETRKSEAGVISGDMAFTVEVEAYGFRIFELTQ